MKQFKMFLLGLLILGVPMVHAAAQPAAAQVLGDMAISPVEPAVPAPEAAAEQVVRLEKVLPKEEVREEELAEKRQARRARIEQEAVENTFEFGMMAGNEVAFGTEISGVPSAGREWTLDSGTASLQGTRLEVEVAGLMFADGTSAAGTRLGTGVACIDSGFHMATGDPEDVEAFTLDENGNASFQGEVDFQGMSCLGPIVLVTDEAGEVWFAATGFKMMVEEMAAAETPALPSSHGEEIEEEDIEDLAEEKADLLEEKAEIEEELAELEAEEDPEDVAEEKEELLAELADLKEELQELAEKEVEVEKEEVEIEDEDV